MGNNKSSTRTNGARTLEFNSSSLQNTKTEWPTEPAVGRVADGIPQRVDRLKGLGNAIVPQVAYTIMEIIKRNEAI
jgi:DNA (cytosine-5)-methyltransferase 1